ncbi:MAG TPA: hypothetical protein VF789_15180 [Thermoanaerobaculia bacterium]
MSRLRRFFSLACLAATLLAPAGFAMEENVPVRLLAPAAGAVLTAGSSAEIAWEPLAPLPGVEEWEAFLSFDDGVTYPVRVTPHLDRDLQRVHWRVPAVPAKQVRLLLRFGDERRETYVRLPQRFSIVASPGMERDLLLARVSPIAGEPALPGERGTVSWVEGDRRGGDLRQVVAETLCFRPGFHLPEGHSGAALADSEEEGPRDPSGRLASRATSSPLAGFQNPHRGRLQAPGRSSDILLLIQRRNE